MHKHVFMKVTCSGHSLSIPKDVIVHVDRLGHGTTNQASSHSTATMRGHMRAIFACVSTNAH